MDTVENRSRGAVYGGMIRLALPIVFQNILSALVTSADVVMLNSVGQSALSSVSLASQYTSILFMVYYGIGTGITMLGAQYWGKRDIRAIELVEGIALRFSLACSLVFFLAALLAPDQMMRVFTTDPELIGLGASYLRIVSPCYLFWSVSEVYLSALRSVERVTISTVLNTAALGLNIALNAVFIFGLLGAPRLGVVGVALATSISRGLELIACLAVSFLSKDVKLVFRDMFARNKVLFRDYIHMALPALGNDVVWGLAYSLYSAIIGHMDSAMVAANSIVQVVHSLATATCFSFGTASTIWLGKQLGAGQREEARQDSKRLVLLTMVTAAMGGLLILLTSPLIMDFATSLDDTARGYLRVMLYINSYYVLGAALNTTLIAGVFRAGGDSKFGFKCDVIDMWGYALPLGFISAFVLKLPPLWVYFLLCTDEFVKWPWVIRHYTSFKWLQNITKDYGQ